MNKNSNQTTKEPVLLGMSTNSTSTGWGYMGYGTGPGNCMSIDLFEYLCSNNIEVTNNVYVCGQGATTPCYVATASGKKPGNNTGSGGGGGAGSTSDGSGSGSGSGSGEEGSGSGGGGGNFIQNPTNNNDDKDKEKEPEKRTNCPDSASANATRVQNVIDDANITMITGEILVDENGKPIHDAKGKVQIVVYDIEKRMLEMRNLAYNSTTENESGFLLEYDPIKDAYRYTQQIIKGEKGKVNMTTDLTTTVATHIHQQGNNSAPSPLDVVFVFNALNDQKMFWENVFHGRETPENETSEEKEKRRRDLLKEKMRFTESIIIAHDGTEYVISVNDLDKIITFLDNSQNSEKFPQYKDFFTDYKDGKFKDGSAWQKQYDEIYTYLEKAKFNQENCQSFALSHILDNNDMGVKIMKRKLDTNMTSEPLPSFKELETVFTEGRDKNGKPDKSKDVYEPRICP